MVVAHLVIVTLRCDFRGQPVQVCRDRDSVHQEFGSYPEMAGGAGCRRLAPELVSRRLVSEPHQVMFIVRPIILDLDPQIDMHAAIEFLA